MGLSATAIQVVVAQLQREIARSPANVRGVDEDIFSPTNYFFIHERT